MITKNVELFTEKGVDHDDEMKEMLHHLEAMINEASSSTGESRFITIESANTINSLAFLGEANQLLGDRQREQQLKQEMVEFNEKSQNTFAEAQTLFETNIHYEPQQNPIDAFGDVLLDVIIGGSKGAYHFAEDVVLGVVEMIEDPVAALEALATMVFNPIDTGYYLGKMIFESFVPDVIHGDAESRAHWFTYALSTVLGPKAVKQVGKKVDSKAKAGAQKAEQQLDDLLPYHQKHQVALVGPVPYNVLNGGLFVDRLVMMAERLPGSLGGMSAGGRNVGKVVIPQKAIDVLDEIIKRKSTPPKGYKGGRTFINNGIYGGQVLPKKITYKEYAVNPKIKGKDRGAERIVIGEDGSAWYTSDHYKTYVRIK